MRGQVNDFKLSENFNLQEFECKHCGAVKLHPTLLQLLQEVRTKLGQPVHIVSGYRCPVHNQREGGVPGSQHLFGRAADITASDMARLRILAEETFVHGGVGRYHNHIHVDVRGVRTRW